MTSLEQPISDLVEPVSKWKTKDVPADDSFRYVDLSSVDQESKEIKFNGELLVKDAPSRARQILKPNDILVSTVRPNLNSVAFLPDKLDGAIGSTGFCVLRAKPKKLCSRYLFHWVKSPQFVADMTKKATGQSYPAVSDKIVKDSLIPLPKDVTEQKRIAAILDQADSLRRARRQAIEKLNTLSQSLFHKEIGNPVTNIKRWPTHEINDLCTLVRGSSPRPKGDPRYYGGNVPRLMIADITRDGWLVTPQIDNLTEEGAKKSRPAPKGTVVMAVSGNIGLVSQLAVDACVHDGFVAFLDMNTRKVMPLYFMHLMHNLKKMHDSWTAGAIFKNITTTDIGSIRNSVSFH